MDERILAILKTLAYGETGSNDIGDSLCLYCNYNPYAPSDDESGLHEPTCPVRVARAVLKEQGTPLLLYRIDYEQRVTFSTDWHATSVKRLAFNEQEALQGYGDWQRNAKATLIREVL